MKRNGKRNIRREFLDKFRLDGPAGQPPELLSNTETALILYSTMRGITISDKVEYVAEDDPRIMAVLDKCAEWRTGAGFLELVLGGAIHILDVHKDGTFKVQLSETFLDDPDWLRRVRRSLEAQSPEEAAQP